MGVVLGYFLVSQSCDRISTWHIMLLTHPFPLNAQVNEETGNRRPVMLTLLRIPRLSKSVKEGNGQELERTLEEGKEVESKPKEEKANGIEYIIAKRGYLEGNNSGLLSLDLFYPSSSR